MSFVTDQVRRIDAQLDRLQLSNATAASSLSAQDTRGDASESRAGHLSERASQLLSILKSLSPSPSARSALVSLSTVNWALQQSQLQPRQTTAEADVKDAGETLPVSAEDPYVRELEWLVISKATTQVYGRLLNLILEQTIPLSQDMDYWETILNSYRYTALYSVQTSPLRLYDFSLQAYRDVRARGGSPIQDGWRQFYGLVKEVTRDLNVADARRRVVSPVTRVRAECRKKRDSLDKIRTMNANALGVLLGEGLSNQSIHENGLASPAEAANGLDAYRDKWKGTILKSVALMDAVLQSVSNADITVDKFDDAVGAATDDDRLFHLSARQSTDEVLSDLRPGDVVGRLQTLLSTRLPAYRASFTEQVREHGRPSRLVRWWLPATALLLSSSTLLRIFANRRAEIITWVEEFGVTVRDFWANWVVEPTRKLIGTIRHDEGSEISIMSKRSLEGDRQSLERMVVDFAVKGNGNLTEAQIVDIRQKVNEGDLTPVLRAYEKDMQSPFMGALRGNLVQALLIQVQKTKVDVEVAMGGVDAMLKSQELLFGLIGLTPGLLIVISVGRWLSGTFGGRRTAAQGRQAGQILQQLRNIDRILTNACPIGSGELLYKDQGLLLCEVHLLRQDAARVMPSAVYRDFVEDIDDLVDVRVGVQRQQKVAERLRWAYAKWLQ